MASRNDIFWCRVFFKAFIKHFRKMSDEEIVKDIRQSMDDLEDLVGDTDTFGSQMVRWANGRADEPLATAAGENGKKGGRPRKDNESTAGAPTREDGVDSKSGTPATISQDAAHRKAADDSKAPTSCNLAYSGKNGLVRLTDDEYALLLQELGNKRKADRLIDDLDYKLAEGATFRQPHLHVLTHWQSYREDKAAEAAEMAKVNADARAEAYSRRGYKTAEERQQEELAKINDFCTGLRNGTIKIAKEG
jgi:hypothetical protein